MRSLSSPEFRGFYGHAELSPREPVIAGSAGTWRVVYHVGSCGIDDGGAIRVARRTISDWGAPQTEHPAAPEYMSVATTGAARVRARYDPKAHVRPWQKAVTITVDDGYLREGDTVTLTLGDTAAGSPGSTAQTYCEPRCTLRVLVDSFGTGRFIELEPAGTFEVISGPAAELHLIAPTDVAAGEPFRASLKALDRWGNPASDFGFRISDCGLRIWDPTNLIGCQDRQDGQFEPSHPVNPDILSSSSGPTSAIPGVLHLDGVRLSQTGVFRLAVEDTASGLRAVSNAITVHPDAPRLRRYWGDLHGQSEETIGTRSAAEYFTFARDQALVDFAGHQGNCFQITAETWERIKEAVRQHHEPGRFVAFLGYEWSGLTPAGGDRNVYFLGDDGPLHRCGHWLVDDRSDAATDCYPVTQLYERLRGRRDVLIVPHVGGRYADMRWHDPELEPVIEISSSWGEFEWLLADALAHGCRVGITCGSDDHKGRPGASYPGSGTFGIRGGLVCVLAQALTREAIWDALRNRRCYGTTGERIALEFEASGVPMGGELAAAAPPVFRIRVGGTDAIERIELRRGMETVVVFPDPALVERSPNRVRIRWSGARNKGRERVARWDGCIECEGTTIVDAAPHAFDSPAEGIIETTPRRVAWKSVTTGDTDGVILTLDPADRGTLRFVSPICGFERSLAELGPAPVIHTAGGLGLQVTVERLPLGVGRDVTVDLRDAVLPEGVTPYHVMVVQRDGSKAWASPIWVSKQHTPPT